MAQGPYRATHSWSDGWVIIKDTTTGGRWMAQRMGERTAKLVARLLNEHEARGLAEAATASERWDREDFERRLP